MTCKRYDIILKSGNQNTFKDLITMFDYPEFNSDGILTLCEMGGKNAEMLMTIIVKRFKNDETFVVLDNECETAFLIQRGNAEISWGSRTEKMSRRDPVPS